ncbi:TPA: hypothetical protein N0F65_000309 [Lagenidium giganteum]|uniref:Zinc ribbon domain-containing protein n=1 Tax=Lagenidium giganteum TaxID=4803 RepID=A0AAV2Z5V6_9STRA|nr:TPA: hypothetical protein N0F65_000309 [Lagenidium giganteum]
MMKKYTQLKFRDAVNVQDPQRIRSLIAECQEELDRMDYYHSIYQAKLREQEMRHNAEKKDAESKKATALVAACSACGTQFESATARFCPECGVKRATII